MREQAPSTFKSSGLFFVFLIHAIVIFVSNVSAIPRLKLIFQTNIDINFKFYRNTNESGN